MANLQGITIQNDGEVKLASGTTSQRPSSPQTGYIRYNTETKLVEHYNGSQWESIPRVSLAGLRLYLDAGNPVSAPTGSNGSIWKNLVKDFPNAIPDVDINGDVNDFEYRSDFGGTVYNDVGRDGGGIPIDLSNWTKQQGTWEFWLRWNGNGYANGLFVNRDDSTANANDWFWLGGWSDGDRFYFRIGDGNDCCEQDLSPSFADDGYPIYTQNRWKQVVCSWDLRADVPYSRITIDGGAFHYERTIANNIPLTNVNNTGRLLLGHDRGSGAQFRGNVSIIRNYDRVLTMGEIRENYIAEQERFA